MVYSKEQKIKIVEWWFETKCYTTVRRRYAREFNVRYVEAPQQKFIQYTVQKFMTKGTVLDCRKEKAGAPITARSPANVDRVRASVQQSPKMPVNACANRNGAHLENVNYKKFA